MEQANQQINQKISLPTKTKIVAWWMITLGVIGGVCSVYLTIHFIRTLPYLGNIIGFLIVCFLSSFFAFFSGLILFTKKRWVWWLSIVMFVIILIITRPSTEFSISISRLTEFSFLEWVLIILLLFPLVLLLLDRKNFWEVSQETLFPVGIRIIAISILLIGVAGLILSVYLFYQSDNIGYHEEWFFFGAIASILCGGMFFVAGFLILLKKRLGWWLAMVMFCIGTALVILIEGSDNWYFGISNLIEDLPAYLMFIVPLVILLLGRKNFFKISS